jgi:hypothetical protein
VRYYLTGHHAYGTDSGQVAHDPALVRAFLDANPDLLDDSARGVLAATDRAAVDASLAQVSPGLAALFAALSPVRVAPDLRAQLVLVHGRQDPAVPYTETLRLAAARPGHTRVVLVGVVAHVEGASTREWLAGVRDLVALWSVVYGLLRAT